jgi:GT2 family glycosyltransferase
MKNTQPKIGVVIIGINVEKYLSDCIRSVQSADYPQERLEVVYVDGGSRDNSPAIAKAIDGVTVIELNDRYPTPGRGRNAGWKFLSTPLIQFMDADTEIDPRWFKDAYRLLSEQVVAVCGHRREKFPTKNNYHRLVNMEWLYEIGPCRYFGGEVLIKREVLEETGGYDEALIAGEDPELSYRIRQIGWQILRIDTQMTTHDINMSTFRQYLKRAFRSGHAYAEIALRFVRNEEKLWLKELTRIVVKAIIPVSFVILGVMIGKTVLGLLLGLLILGKPYFRLGRIKRQYRQTWKTSILYVGHTALVVYPQFCGVLRYFWGIFTRNPLKNKGLDSQGMTFVFPNANGDKTEINPIEEKMNKNGAQKK